MHHVQRYAWNLPAPFSLISRAALTADMRQSNAFLPVHSEVRSRWNVRRRVVIARV